MSFEGDFESAKKVLGSRIRRRRDKLGLSQEELAALALVDRRHMSDIETGKAEPGFWTLTRICSVLDTTTPMFLRGLKWDPDSDKWGRPKESGS
jgi:transcriptional regulator with XRE-family HTH domain